MNVLRSVALLSAGIGLAMGAAQVHAEQGFYVSSNATDKCQPFFPGGGSGIRNRVIGVENAGATTTAVACVFELEEIDTGGSPVTDSITISMRNSGATEVTTSCTVLPGTFGGTLGTAVTQNLVLPAGGGADATFTGPWTVFGIGVNCNLPPSVILNHTVIRYRTDQTATPPPPPPP